MRRPFVFIGLVLTGVGIDLFSKWWVFRSLTMMGEYELIPGIFHIVRAENHGVAFSMFSGQTILIEIVSFVIIVALSITYRRSRSSAPVPMLAAMCLLLMGAIGNLYDRLMFRYVRDFIDFKPRIPGIGHWAVFNFADICITTGVIYLFFEFIIRPAPAAGASSPPGDAQI